MNDWVVETPSFEEDLMNNRVVMLNQNGVNRVVEIIKEKDKEIEELKRQIKIKDNWCRLIYDIGYDYDGFRNDIEGLRGVVDELVRYSVGALESDDKTAVYVGEENGVEIKENILMERIESDKE